VSDCCSPKGYRWIFSERNAAADAKRYRRKGTWWTRAGLAIGNVALRVSRREFQVFLHSPAGIFSTSMRQGLRLTLDEQGIFWTVAALRKAA